jgi:hypothetical protein
MTAAIARVRSALPIPVPDAICLTIVVILYFFGPGVVAP